MANCDKVSELYLGRIADERMQLICRRRIHWLCGQVAGKTVLDVGCSQGIASVLLAREGFTVTGLDVEEGSIEFPRTLLAQEQAGVQAAVTFVQGDATRMGFPDASFDTALLGEVIEHLVHPGKVLAEVARVVKPDGRVVVTTPLGLHIYHDHKRPFYLTAFLDLMERYFTVQSVELVDKTIFCVAKNARAAMPFWKRSASFHDLVACFESEILRFEEGVHLQRDEWKARNQRLSEAHEKERDAHRQDLREREHIVSELKQRIETLQKEILNERERFAGAAGELGEKGDRLRTVLEQRDVLQQDLGAQRALAATALERLARAETELQSRVEQLDEARARIAKLEAATAKAAELRGELRALRVRASRSQVSLQKARDSLTTERERVAVAGERARNLEAELARQAQAASEARAEMQRACDASVAEARESASEQLSERTRNFEAELARQAQAAAEARAELQRTCDKYVDRLSEASTQKLAAAQSEEQSNLQAVQAAKSCELAALAEQVQRITDRAAREHAATQANCEKRLAIAEDEAKRIREQAVAEMKAMQEHSAVATEDAVRKARKAVVAHIDGEITALRESECLQRQCEELSERLRGTELKLAHVVADNKNTALRLEALRSSKLGSLTLKYWACRAALRKRAIRWKAKQR